MGSAAANAISTRMQFFIRPLRTGPGRIETQPQSSALCAASATSRGSLATDLLIQNRRELAQAEPPTSPRYVPRAASQVEASGDARQTSSGHTLPSVGQCSAPQLAHRSRFAGEAYRFNAFPHLSPNAFPKVHMEPGKLQERNCRAPALVRSAAPWPTASACVPVRCPRRLARLNVQNKSAAEMPRARGACRDLATFALRPEPAPASKECQEAVIAPARAAPSPAPSAARSPGSFARPKPAIPPRPPAYLPKTGSD